MSCAQLQHRQTSIPTSHPRALTATSLRSGVHTAARRSTNHQDLCCAKIPRGISASPGLDFSIVPRALIPHRHCKYQTCSIIRLSLYCHGPATYSQLSCQKLHCHIKAVGDWELQAAPALPTTESTIPVQSLSCRTQHSGRVQGASQASVAMSNISGDSVTGTTGNIQAWHSPEHQR